MNIWGTAVGGIKLRVCWVILGLGWRGGVTWGVYLSVLWGGGGLGFRTSGLGLMDSLGLGFQRVGLRTEDLGFRA